MGRGAEALECFERASLLDGGRIELLSARATALLSLNRLDEALAGFDDALGRYPGHAASWCNRGNVLVSLRRFQDAVASYDRALAIQPDLIEATHNRKYALGMSYFERGRFEEAQYVLDEALRLNPHLLDGICIRGIALLRLKRHQEAIACFDRALAANPGFIEALSNRATAYLESNRAGDALAGFDETLKLDPVHAVSWNNRGNALMALKRHEDALASYERALAIQPTFPEAQDNRDNALFALRRLSRCPPAFMRALFDDYCPYYDAAMVEGLNYRGHIHLRDLAESVVPGLRAPKRILDLGSGTGLVGEVFKDLAQGGRLDGIDLSPLMIQAARARGIYDDLVLGDLETVLPQSNRLYDLILAADTIVYFGDLGPLFGRIARRLEPGGFFIFAVEASPGESWEQMPTNRFRHSEAYLRGEATQAQLDFVAIVNCAIRREFNDPVAGFAVALQKPSSAHSVPYVGPNA
jgi:predicted TPR repeat methyltransferase